MHRQAEDVEVLVIMGISTLCAGKLPKLKEFCTCGLMGGVDRIGADVAR